MQKIRRIDPQTGDRDTLARLQPFVSPLIENLHTRATGSALFPTDETLADDPIALPYCLSSHILFWRTLELLNKLVGGWEHLATEVHRAVNRSRQSGTANAGMPVPPMAQDSFTFITTPTTWRRPGVLRRLMIRCGGRRLRSLFQRRTPAASTGDAWDRCIPARPSRLATCRIRWSRALGDVVRQSRA
ncbi:MAG: hypothetical protein HXY41_17825 [Chloroflexi bacterium]|nr:hypothetical protein [Chloroflexota bacterium]